MCYTVVAYCPTGFFILFDPYLTRWKKSSWSDVKTRQPSPVAAAAASSGRCSPESYSTHTNIILTGAGCNENLALVEILQLPIQDCFFVKPRENYRTYYDIHRWATVHCRR